MTIKYVHGQITPHNLLIASTSKKHNSP